jgi:hypothetical protein
MGVSLLALELGVAEVASFVSNFKRRDARGGAFGLGSQLLTAVNAIRKAVDSCQQGFGSDSFKGDDRLSDTYQMRP